MLTREAVERMLDQRNAAADYERGRIQAMCVLRTLGLNVALQDVRAFLGLATVPAGYTAGYTDVVLNAASQG